MPKYTIILSFFSLVAYSQQVLTTSGDTFVSPEASVSWTLGEIATETYKATGTTATQGMQQPTLSITTHSSDQLLQMNVAVFPNPTSLNVQLSFQEQTIEQLTYSLCDIKGVEVLKGNITQSEYSIDLSSVPTATYLLKVSKAGKEQNVFKIIKQ